MKSKTAGRGRYLLPLCSMFLACTASAQESPLRVRLGVASINFHESASMAVAGTTVPGASASLSNNATVLAEVGYMLSPSWSVALTAGLPPTTKVRGVGTAATLGEIGRVKYAPAGLALQYQFNEFGKFKPYVGAGALYFISLSDKDGSMTNLKVENTWGSLLQLGVEYELSQRMALFADFKRLGIKTSASGNLPAFGGAPATANVRLNPTVLQVGLSFRF